jgi:hypothetical protein
MRNISTVADGSSSVVVPPPARTCFRVNGLGCLRMRPDSSHFPKNDSQSHGAQTLTAHIRSWTNIATLNAVGRAQLADGGEHPAQPADRVPDRRADPGNRTRDFRNCRWRPPSAPCGSASQPDREIAERLDPPLDCGNADQHRLLDRSSNDIKRALRNRALT